MFDDLHVQDDVKLFTRCGHRLSRRVSIVDIQTGLTGVGLCDGDIPLRGINANNFRTKTAHRFAQKAATTANVQNS